MGKKDGGQDGDEGHVMMPPNFVQGIFLQSQVPSAAAAMGARGETITGRWGSMIDTIPRQRMGRVMKNLLCAGFCFFAVLAGGGVALGQSPAGLSNPSRTELESVIGGMGLSMGEKLSLRKILQTMQEQGAAVKADGSLSDSQKMSRIVQIRKDALDQTRKILTADQQQQLEVLLLPGN